MLSPTTTTTTTTTTLLAVTTLLLVCSNAFASHYHSKQAPRPTENEIDDNYPPDSVDVSASSATPVAPSHGPPYASHRGDFYVPPSPFVKPTEQRHLPTAYLPHPSRVSSHSSSNRRLRPFDHGKRPSSDEQTEFGRGGGPGAGYILTAGGREKLYDGEGEHKISPYASPFVSSAYGKKFAFDKAFKKYRFAYANVGGNGPIVVGGGGGGVGGVVGGSAASSTHAPDDRPDGGKEHTTMAKDVTATAGTVPSAADVAVIPLSRTLNALHAAPAHAHGHSAPVAHHKFFTEKTDMYAGKGTVWKQLGPNVEISSAAEHVPFGRPVAVVAKERKKSKASSQQQQQQQQQRKGGHKNPRTGYMTQQHALYVANSVANNFKALKGAGIGGGGGGGNFDHNTVLRQSDKFELTDAMISEAEKEEAYKNAKALRVRFKQELPPPPAQGLSAAYQQPDPYEPQSAQYYAPPFSVFAAHGLPFAVNPAALPSSSAATLPNHLATFGKGFVRHIEVETNGGPRKIMPALIIPLSADPAAISYVGGGGGGGGETAAAAAAAAASVYLNHVPDRHTKAAFPYDIVAAPRYAHPAEAAVGGNAILPSASAESYHLQPFAQLHYQYKTQLADDSPYSGYASPHYHNHNLYNTRFAFLNGGAGAASLTTATPNSVDGTTSGGGGGVTAAAYNAPRSSRFSASLSGGASKKTPPAQHSMVADSSEHKPITVSPPPQSQQPPSATSISTYIYDGDEAAASEATAVAYMVAPSESTYFATMTNVREADSRASRQSAAAAATAAATVTKHYERSDMRRD